MPPDAKATLGPIAAFIFAEKAEGRTVATRRPVVAPANEEQSG